MSGSGPMDEAFRLRHESSEHLEVVWGSWIGRLRDTNQDAAAVCAEENLLIVSDGMGGGAAGEWASRTVTQRLPGLVAYHLQCADGAREPHASAEAMHGALRDAVMELNHLVREDASGMSGVDKGGATVVAAIALPEDMLWVVHMGDSRAYRLRGGELVRLTRDHSLVNRLLDLGMAAADDETDLLEHRGKLTRYVGIGGGFEADVSCRELLAGDRLLLCTDGLTEVLDDERIGRLLGGGRGLQEACRALLTAACEAGSLDNTTAMVAQRKG